MARWIPNPKTFESLYGKHGWRHIKTVGKGFLKTLKREGRIGKPISNGAHLVRGSGPRVYLVTNGQKRWIVNPATMTRFKFDWKRIVVKSNYMVNSIRMGATVTPKGRDSAPAKYTSIGLSKYRTAYLFRRNASWRVKKVRC